MSKIIGKRNIVLLLCIFIIALLNQPLLEPGFQRTVRGLFVSFAYISVAMYWGITVLESTKEKHSRGIMFSIVGLILFWLIIRACKYEIWDDNLDIALWYLYYVPQTMLPLLVFDMTVHIEGGKQTHIEKLLYIPASVIIIGILTNNVHQLAFKFKDSVVDNSGSYSYGVLYYISLVWMILLMLAAIINATRKSRILHKKRVFFILLLWTLVPILYFLYYQFGPFFLRTCFFNFPEGCCILHIIFLEICIQSGLIMSNRHHEDIFESSTIMAEITDVNNVTLHKTDLYEVVSNEEKEEAKRKNVIVKDSFELRSNSISGGFVYWLNDVREILKVNKDLQELGEELAEENNILKAEIEAKEKQAALEEQNRIYDSVDKALVEKRNIVLRLLDEKNIYKALVVAAYMKRKGNLVIWSKQSDRSDIRELGLCINESFSYLGLKGCICNCTVFGEGMIKNNIISSLYDIVEETIEMYYDKIEAFLCYIKCENDEVTMRCQLEFQDELLEPNDLSFSDEYIDTSMEIQDTTLYLSCKAKEAAYE